LDLSIEELEGLLEQARQEPLREDGYQRLLAAVRTLRYVTELEKKESTLARLRELLCPASTEKTEKVLKQAGIEQPAGFGKRGPAHGASAIGRKAAAEQHLSQ
jgi:hypothetical protein